MNKASSLFAFMIVVIISGCSSNSTVSTPPAEPNRPPVIWTKQIATMDEQENAKATVVSKLKDPESARFGEIWAMQGTNGKRSVCGYVNAKNSYGGYTGQKMFSVSNSHLIMEGNDILGRLLPEVCTPRTVN
ncbi:hypothetical protein ACIGCM_08805 [Pseudomonas sp. NPDC078700]|uniref:hypothetical protein n=1 Tax=Pseudomonas sp. NPDC078700 TaxID=3364424 RepID=UPI0037CC9345